MEHTRNVSMGGRLDFKYIHGHYASLVVHRKRLQTVSETTSVPLCNLHNH